MPFLWPLFMKPLIALSFVCILLATQFCLGDDDLSQQEIQRLVQQLGDDSYTIRQSAMKILWADRKTTLELLRNGTEGVEPEAAARIRRILQHLEQGLSPEVPPKIAQMVFAFGESSEEERYVILYSLREMGEHQWVMNLIMSLSEETQRDYLAQVIYVGGSDLVEQVLDWEEFSLAGASLANLDHLFAAEKIGSLDRLMNHDLMWKYFLHDAVVYHEIRGLTGLRLQEFQATLDRQLTIAPLPAAAPAVHATEGPTADDWRVRLIAMHRVRNEHSDAIKLASQMDRDSSRVVKQLRIENGKWQALGEDKRSHESPMESALYDYWLGHHRQVQRSLAKLQTAAEKEIDKELISRQAALHMLMLDSDWLLEHASDLDPYDGFQLLCGLERYALAFQLIEMPTEVERRQSWFRKKVRRIKRNLFRYGADDPFDQGGADAEGSFLTCLELAYQIGNLGDKQQALEWLEMLAQALGRSSSVYASEWRLQIFAKASELTSGQAIWDFYDRLKMGESMEDTHTLLFPDATVEGHFWDALLQESIPDPRNRSELLTTLLKCPLGNPDFTIDLDQLVESAKVKTAHQANYPQILVYLAQTLRINGRKEQARDLLMESGYQGNAAAFRLLGNQAVATRDWTAAANWYSKSYQLSLDPIDLYRLGLSRSGNTIEPTVNRICQAARLIELHSFRQMQFCDLLSEFGHKPTALAMLESHVRSMDLAQERVSFFAHRLALLAEGQTPDEGMDYWRATQLFYLSSARFEGATTLPLIQYVAQQSHMAHVRQLLNEAKIDQAMSILMRCAHLLGSQAALAENFVPRLKELGYHDEADQLFAEISQRFQETLASFPNSPFHNNNYAWTCAVCQQHLEPALQHARHAVALEPRNTSYLDTLAEIEFLLGHRDTAIALAKKCMDLNPHKAHYREQLIRFQTKVADEVDHRK